MTLQPGHVCWSRFSNNPQNDNYLSQTSENPALAFALNGNGGRVIYRCGETFQYFKSGYAGAQMVFRLPEGCATPVRYDISSFSKEKLTSCPTAWTIEGSADGISWRVLDSKSDQIPSAGGIWYSDGTPVKDRAGDAANVGWELDYEKASDILNNVSSYSVAAGATLRTEGEVSPLISKLRIDAAEGVGSISGFKFAEKVTVDVTGIAKSQLELTLPFDFASCEGFADAQFSFTADGKTDTHIFTVAGGKLKIYRKQGVRIIVK